MQLHALDRAARGIAAAAALILLVAGNALADPPARAIRLAYTAGAVSFLPSGENEWVQARINRPLWMGDRLWSDRGARAELQIGGATLFAAPETSVSVLNFDDEHAQFEITQGTLTVDVRSLGSGDTIEIDTPNLAFVVRRAGQYRIDVEPSGQSTAVGIVRGEGEAFGTNAAYVLRTGNRFRFYGNDLADYDAEPVAVRDPFDSWVASRVSARDRSISARYVSPDTIGYADLDNYGTWRTVPSYGAVWVPTRVDADWAPYRNGHWTWVDPWGWTWVDDAPWGFTPFHYGRWAYVDNRWCWVPGPRNTRAVYAPALVAFVGGDNFRIAATSGAAGSIGWFPLAPGEVYRPAYTASRDYFTRVNVSNTVVNVTSVTSAYSNPRAAQVRYANVSTANAVTAVPIQAFVQSQPVQRAAVRIDRAALQNAPVTGAAAIAPVRASVVGASPAAQAKPAPQVTERPVVAKQAPPAAPVAFERREAALKQQPGKPLDQPEVAKNAPAATAPPPNVKVVQSQAPAAAHSVPPAPARNAGERRERTPPVAQPATPPAQAAQPAPPPAVTAQPAPEQRRGPPEGRGPNARPEPAAKAPEPQRPAQVAPPPPQAAQPAPAPPVTAQPAPEQRRGPPEGRAANARPEPAAKAPEPQRPAQVAPPPPQAAQPTPPSPVMAQPAPEQRRGPPEQRNAFNPRPETAAKASAPPPPAPQAAPAPQVTPAPHPPPAAVAQPQPQHAPSAAAPAPEAAPAQPQTEAARRGERGPPPAKGKDRDTEKDKKE